MASAGEINCPRLTRRAAKGCVHTVHVLTRADLDRQVVKSPTCTVTIPEFSLTIPASRGQLTNIEGLVADTARDLEFDQPLRKAIEPDAYTKIEALVGRLRDVLEDEEDEDENGQPIVRAYAKGEKPLVPFTLKLDDPAGNSFVQFLGSVNDSKWSMRAYSRTREQNAQLGLVAEEEVAHASGSAAGVEARIAADGPSSGAGAAQRDAEGEPNAESVAKAKAAMASAYDPLDPSVVPDEIFHFPGACSSCGHEIMTLMQKVNIPHFKVSFKRAQCDLSLRRSPSGHHHHVHQLRPLRLPGQ